jgi:hypothetical protein
MMLKFALRQERAGSIHPAPATFNQRSNLVRADQNLTASLALKAWSVARCASWPS